MIEKSIYEDYVIDFKSDYVGHDKAYHFIFNNKRQLYLTKDLKIPLLTSESIRMMDPTFSFYIGTYKNKPLYLAHVDEATDNYHELFEVYDISHDTYLMATRAVLVNDWYITHQYCGRCSTKTVLDDKDMMLKCPECGQPHYPRIAPAIIVAINKNGKLLMAKHTYHEKIKYALIAGFVEAGESIEEAVHREVQEEVGIKIKNLQYHKSQSWPFPNSLMLAFTADYESGEINVDGEEISQAKWFDKEEIEMYDSDISISAWLLEHHIQTH